MRNTRASLDGPRKIRIRRQFHERFISQPTSHRKRKSNIGIFIFCFGFFISCSIGK